jgi:hypothetical protein
MREALSNLKLRVEDALIQCADSASCRGANHVAQYFPQASYTCNDGHTASRSTASQALHCSII